MTRWALGLGLIGLVLSSSACSTKKLAVGAMTPMLDDMLKAVEDQPDPMLVREALPSNLLLIDSLARIAPDNATVAVKAAQGFCSYALVFVQDEDADRAHTLFEQGRDHAMRAVTEDAPDIAAALEGGDLKAIEAALEGADEDDVPALFWAGNCWAGAINTSGGSPRALGSLPRVEMMMNRVVEIDRGYYHAGPLLFQGILNASRPKALGGDPSASKAAFEQVFTLTEGKFLLAKVFYAQYYARQVQDAALFRSALEEVIAAPDDILPGQSLVTQVSKQKARALLDDIELYFDIEDEG